MGLRPSPGDRPAGIAAVGEDRLGEGKGAAREARDALGAVAILDVGGVDLDRRQSVSVSVMMWRSRRWIFSPASKPFNRPFDPPS
ncbi:MAG TPA: hypothetical protein VJ994_03270 [Paracoccaceae bacterium]|nr:hypothetical protein [Paracoccaceae bacterium]